MLLTHPEREVQLEQLHVNCAGDDYDPYASGYFEDAPFFYYGGLFGEDKLRFGANWLGKAIEYYGSVTAFLPK